MLSRGQEQVRVVPRDRIDAHWPDLSDAIHSEERKAVERYAEPVIETAAVDNALIATVIGPAGNYLGQLPVRSPDGARIEVGKLRYERIGASCHAEQFPIGGRRLADAAHPLAAKTRAASKTRSGSLAIARAGDVSSRTEFIPTNQARTVAGDSTFRSVSAASSAVPSRAIS